MAITKEKKVAILKDLKGIVEGALSLVFVHFKGLSVAEANELRAALKKDGVKYLVVKKTLLKRTLTEAGVSGEQPDLPGEVAMAYLPKPAEGEGDLTGPARGLNEFVKKFGNKLTFLGSVLEGKFLSKEETVSVASIPPTPVLRGMFVNVINSPIQGFVIALNQIAEKKS